MCFSVMIGVKTLIDLEIRPIDRKNILKELETKDYSEGPIEE